MKKISDVIQKGNSAVLAGIAAFAAVVAGATGLLDGLQAFLVKFGAAPAWVQGVGIALFALVIGGLLFDAVRRRSRLRQPDAFRIDATDPRLLVGRKDEVERIVKLRQHQPLIFLVGESGSGKSALLQGGVVPALEKANDLAVYLDLSGLPWDTDARTALLGRLRARLSEAARAQYPAETTSVEDVLRHFRDQQARRVIFVFDQFDDYQLEHLAHFRQDGLWQPAEDIAARSPFWGPVSRWLGDGLAQLLVATRSDTAAGLDCIRFAKAASLSLERIDGNLIAPLLTLIAPPTTDEAARVVDQPDAGWDRLQGRLLKDISEDHRILPVRLTVLLDGLRRLDFLTVAAYEKAGGATGLERLHIERNVADAAKASRLAASQVMQVLEALCDVEGSKTLARIEGDLRAAAITLERPTVDGEALRRALAVLEQQRIVRRAAGESAADVAAGAATGTAAGPGAADTIWLLHHDFLARGVVLARQRTDRWRLLLERCQQAFEDAPWLAKWSTLLPLTAQYRILVERLRGRLRYRREWRIALLSLFRLAPVVGAIALIVWGAQYSRQQEQEKRAEALFNALSSSSGFSANEIQQLLAGIDEGGNIQELVIRWTFDRLDDVDRTAAKFDVVVQTWLGLDADGGRRRRLHGDIVAPALKRHPDDLRAFQLAALAWQVAPGADEDAKRLVGALHALTLRQPDVPRFTQGLRALQLMPARLDGERLHALMGRLHALNPAFEPSKDEVVFSRLLAEQERADLFAFFNRMKQDQQLAGRESATVRALLQAAFVEGRHGRSAPLDWLGGLAAFCDRLNGADAQRLFIDSQGWRLDEPSTAAAVPCRSVARPVATEQLERMVRHVVGGDSSRHGAHEVARSQWHLAGVTSQLTDAQRAQLLKALTQRIAGDADLPAGTVELWARLVKGSEAAVVRTELPAVLRAMPRHRDRTFAPGGPLQDAIALLPADERTALAGELLRSLTTAPQDRARNTIALIAMLEPEPSTEARLQAARFAIRSTIDSTSPLQFQTWSDLTLWTHLTRSLSAAQCHELAVLITSQQSASLPDISANWMLIPLASRLEDRTVAAMTRMIHGQVLSAEQRIVGTYTGTLDAARSTFFLWAAQVVDRDPTVVNLLPRLLTDSAAARPRAGLIHIGTNRLDDFQRPMEPIDERVRQLELQLVRGLRTVSPQALVDMLKQPFMAGPTQRIVLLALGERLGRRFDDSRWAFVDAAAAPANQSQWAIDLQSPPKAASAPTP